MQSWLGRKQHPVVPLGLLTVAASLAPGDVAVLDLNVVADPMRELASRLSRDRPSTIGISLRNADTTSPFDRFSYVPSFLAQVRTAAAVLPDSQLLAGGPGYSLFHRELRAAVPVISGDTVGHHEEEIPVPRWDLIDLNPYLPYQGNLSIGVEVTRGCTRDCSYCVYPSLSGRTVRDKCLPELHSEVEMLRKRGVGHIFLCAPVLNHSPGRGEQVAQAIAGTGVTWEAYHSPVGFSPRYAGMLVESGCTAVSFSPDGGLDSDMRALGKDFGVADMDLAVKAASDAGLRVFISLFPHLPWSTPVSMTRAFSAGRRWGAIAGANLARLRFGAIRRLPGSSFGPGRPALYGSVPRSEFVLPRRPWDALFRLLVALSEKRLR